MEQMVIPILLGIGLFLLFFLFTTIKELLPKKMTSEEKFQRDFLDAVLISRPACHREDPFASLMDAFLATMEALVASLLQENLPLTEYQIDTKITKILGERVDYQLIDIYLPGQVDATLERLKSQGKLILVHETGTMLTKYAWRDNELSDVESA